MRSLLSLATFAIGVLCFVSFVSKVRPDPIIATPPLIEQTRTQNESVDSGISRAESRSLNNRER